MHQPSVRKVKPQESIVDYYLGVFREGRCDDAFHSLIEAEASRVVPELISVYEEAGDVDTQVFAIEVISEFRLDSSCTFLRHALRTDDPEIWKRALDGLAMAESPEAVEAMKHVLSTITDADKRAWIAEAIADTETEIRRKRNRSV